MGIAAGGMDDGSIMLWDIDTLYKDGDAGLDHSNSHSLISNQLVHEGSCVNAIQFNPSIQNLLASGGSEVLIQDIQHNIEEPTLFTPGQPNFHEGATVTAISWNKVVPFILASAGNDGSVVVWDLKNTKAIFNLKDPNLVSYSYDPFSDSNEEQLTANYQIIWSLKVPTQFLIWNDLETMSMWDLRRSDTPLFSIADTNCSQVIGSAWCPHDDNLFVSSFNSGKVSFFHSDTGSIISEINDGKKYISMEWSPNHKGVLLAYNTDNETKIIDFGASTSIKTEQSETLYAPKWLSRPLGARFGFGGKLVTFSSNKEAPIKLYNTQSSPELWSKIEKSEEARSTQPLNTIIDSFIEKSSKSEIEKMEWVTIRSLWNKNFDSLFSLFDINKEEVINEAEKLSGKKKLKQKTQKSDLHLKSNNNDLSNLDANQANEFFANFSENHEKKLEEEEKKSEVKAGPKITQEVISRNSNWDESGEGVIKRNLLVGNIEGAAECALKWGRTTEALLLALASNNESFIEQIKAEYFTQNKDNFVNTVIKGIVNKETEEMILDLSQTNWKEALAYALSFSQKKQSLEILLRELLNNYIKRKEI